MTLKFTEELCHDNAKFEEELNFHFKTDMRNLTNLHFQLKNPPLRNLKKLLFNLLFKCPKKLSS